MFLQGILHFSAEISSSLIKVIRATCIPTCLPLKGLKVREISKKEAKPSSFFVVWRGKLKERTHTKVSALFFGAAPPYGRLAYRMARVETHKKNLF